MPRAAPEFQQLIAGTDIQGFHGAPVWTVIDDTHEHAG